MSKPAKDLITNDDPDAGLCTAGGLGGLEHDYRPWTEPPRHMGHEPRTYLRCVWCHVVACGNYGEPDPCIEPYHHRVAHRTRAGVTWPIGGTRPR